MVINAGWCVAGTCRGGLSTVEVEVIKDDLETVVVVTVSMFQILYIHLRHDSLFDFTFHIKFNFTFRGCFHFFFTFQFVLMIFVGLVFFFTNVMVDVFVDLDGRWCLASYAYDGRSGGFFFIGDGGE